MKKHPNPELLDADNPEWNATEVRRAKPASVVLPELFGSKAAKEMLKPRGRPVSAVVKERITIRLDPDVVAAFKATGRGWQTRVNDAMREWVKTHTLV